tara:strand:- start:140 stop:409 length:270 start_codon:yes stop_codon:yes gene_type:complete
LIHYYSEKSGRHVEIEPVVVNIRTPGQPEPRDFTCTATIVDGVAYISLGSSHSNQYNPHEVMTSIKEALKSIGANQIKFKRIKPNKVNT